MNWALVHIIVVLVLTAIVVISDDANWHTEKIK